MHQKQQQQQQQQQKPQKMSQHIRITHQTHKKQNCQYKPKVYDRAAKPGSNFYKNENNN